MHRGGAPYWTSYSVDDVTGNRTQTIAHPTVAGGATTTSAYAYPAAGTAHPHAVTAVTKTGGATGTSSYGYDAAGDTAVRPGQTLTWSPQGKLATVVANAKTQTNIYATDGSLLLQTDPTNGSTLFIGETQLHVAAGSTVVSAVRDYSVAGSVTAERTTKPGVAGSVLYYTLTDANNTVYAEINVTTGAVTRRYVDPYGNARGATPAWSSGNGYLNKPTDSFDGLTQLGARGYDSLLGRFASVDAVLSAGNPAQNNGYSYSANNPITSSEPSGDCYSVSSDSLDMRTNCVGSNGSVAGPGAATAPNGGAVGGEAKNGSHGMSSSDYGRYQGQKADSVPSTDGFGKDDATAGGQLILGFIFGQIQSDIVLGSNSRIVDTMRKSQNVLNAIKKLKKRLAGHAGIEDPPTQAGYDAQDANGLGNFLRDVGTYANFEQASEIEQMESALGSYEMTASVVGIDPDSRTATVVFRGSNYSTLGSAIGVIPATRPLLDDWVTDRDATAGRGPVSPVFESWSFSETVPW